MKVIFNVHEFFMTIITQRKKTGQKTGYKFMKLFIFILYSIQLKNC